MNQRARYAVRGALLLLVPGSTLAQSLEQRIARAPEGTVRFSYAARPGVYGNGRNVITWDCQGGSGKCRSQQINGNFSDVADSDWASACDSGPVRIALTVRSGAVTDVRAYVGGTWRAGASGTDLGTVSARDASAYLLQLATTATTGSRAAQKAFFPALLADSVAPTIWRDLLGIARDANVSRKVRRSAVFWVGQAASDAATRGLTDLVADGGAEREVREQAVFALSQRPRAEGVPALIRIAKENNDPEIRRKAIFWLGQSEDPRALALFEELLSRP